MKLAIVTAYPPSKVTLTEYGYHLVKHFRLQEEVSEIVLLTDVTEAPKDLSFEEPGCPITVKECWSFNDYRNAFKIMRAIRQEKPDAVLFNLQFLKFGDKKIPAALGLLLPFICRIMGIPTISLLHNIMEQVDLDNAGITQNKILQRIYNFIGSTLTRFVLASDVLAVTISKYKGILEKKYKARNVALIPHGSFETPPTPDFTLPEGPLQVMAFGKFGTYKKVESLIEAVELIRRDTELDIEVVIAGTDSPNTPGYLEGVKNDYAHVAQLRFTGYVAEEDVPRIFNESAVVVFPYTSTTGSSGVLHQAGSYGKAVVLPDLGDLGILVREEGYRGEFFEPQDVESLAAAIRTLLIDENYRTHLGVQNYKAACSLPMSAIAGRYVDYFKAIILAKDTKQRIELPTHEHPVETVLID
ncbi:Glycosyltransferase involved in cell wall bisynthesis [Robiginitalea myxolifaciens]|uniref:Glycosyltransferase involved in cell wall bisynthesis n=1 Tax=Robiginitalea myxolifaciens TaxID=400055 RepID=A0A1I6FN17_9FLAO|nr:glycosyltransferase [Robiginitalea myxolifaciens]SFR31355.1 Glycosyltransferase involved in cell wall bisynthesis [Robiginitalea myxolifaciens]